ncbi:polysaccharide biosynthesis/export family protein [Mucilaginibacter sp. UR6-11]|uniref:polysaccharide biosynthesis/export family protein n=1 Tax=Mucilaginibacter sp. UR6-11 TaxID=1435644 RepID=UPI001E2AF8C6|nr:polysaccharide biosynthesis/export family protein [Mucilaginibacter sp. UR6-11]MCC8425713.1 polysaccharide biosynthesis/export family protein [Mucilaginibacter sp. UR6-11]
MRYLIILSLITGLFFTSCSYKQDQALFERKTLTPDSSLSQNLSNISNYRIKPQDILQITNVQNSKSLIDLSAGASLASGGNTGAPNTAQEDIYLVDEDGLIGLPGLGRVPIAGLTRTEARKHLEELYSKELKHPLLEVKIINLKVNITGEVKAPGNVVLTKDRPTLIEVLGDAGGLTANADEKHIKIIRADKNSTIDIIDLSDIRTLTSPRIIVQNNDIIYVAQNRKAIRNSNLQNFSALVQPALLLVNTVLIILTLVRK